MNASARDMVDRQLATRDIADTRVLDAMRAVPREAFVPQQYRAHAYEDRALPIAQEQTISQPYIVALMAQAARIAPGDRVLEVGAGSGYAAAVLGRLAARVFAIERHEVLASEARERIAQLGMANVSILAGDGTLGLPDEAPFDAIIVSAGAARVPDALREQLAVGGRMVIPLDSGAAQTLRRITRVADADYRDEALADVRFVPLVEADRD